MSMYLKIYSNGDKIWKDVKTEDWYRYKKQSGYESWWNGTKRHRLDGPALIWSNGNEEWWIDGKQINCKTQEEFEQYLRLKAFW